MIAEVLGIGREKAKTAKDLSSCLGMKVRDVNKAVQVERRAGKPICATNSYPLCGYYLAANRGEMERFCAGLFRRAKEIFKTRAACLKTLEELPGDDTP